MKNFVQKFVKILAERVRPYAFFGAKSKLKKNREKRYTITRLN